MILEAYLNERLFGFNKKQELQMSDELLDEIFKFVKSELLKYNKYSICYEKRIVSSFHSPSIISPSEE